jgi:ABC-2 type transport system ATP-binding protein
MPEPEAPDAPAAPVESAASAAPEPEPGQPPAAVEFRSASRWYGQVIAVNDVTAAIGPGITALLGPNGAGKSTLMRMALGLIRPSQGEVRILGEDPWNNPALLRRVGHVGAGAPPWSHLSGAEVVARGARLSGVDPARAGDAAAEALRSVGLDPADERPVSSYSHGMQQRVKFALATVHRPTLLVLDEPLLGTDPLVRQTLLARMRELAAGGATLLLSTHVLSDVESLTDRILLLHHGRLLAHGPVPEIRDLLDRHPRTVRITAADAGPLAAELLGWDSVQSVHKEPAAVVVRTHAAAEFFPRLQDAIADGRIRAAAVATLDDNVEAVVRYLAEGEAA